MLIWPQNLKCLFLDPPLALNFLETLTFSFLKVFGSLSSSWKFPKCPGLLHPPFFICLSFSFNPPSSTSLSSPTLFSTGILLGLNKLCSGIRLLGTGSWFYHRQTVQTWAGCKKPQVARRNKWGHACKTCRIVPAYKCSIIISITLINTLKASYHPVLKFLLLLTLLVNDVIILFMNQIQSMSHLYSSLSSP